MSFAHPSTRPHKISSGGKDAVLWGDTAILLTFFPALVPSAYVPGAVITSSVNAATVRRYPGDKGYSRKEHPAKRLNKIPPKMGGALPGNPFGVRKIDAAGVIDMSAIWQFRYQGSWLTITKWAYDNLKDPGACLYSPSGHPYLLPTELPRNPPDPIIPIP